jgi:dihydroorotate dehydrogenase
MLPGEMEAVVEAVLRTRAKGLILANTTLARDRLAAPGELTAETGGLSGAPLLTGTRGLVRRARALVGDRLAIIASGGIGSGEDAAMLVAAGADCPAVNRHGVRGRPDRRSDEAVRSR